VVTDVEASSTARLNGVTREGTRRELSVLSRRGAVAGSRAGALRHTHGAPGDQGGLDRRVPGLEGGMKGVVQLRHLLVSLGVALTVVLLVAKVVDELRARETVAVENGDPGDVGVFTSQAGRDQDKRGQQNTNERLSKNHYEASVREGSNRVLISKVRLYNLAMRALLSHVHSNPCRHLGHVIFSAS